MNHDHHHAHQSDTAHGRWVGGDVRDYDTMSAGVELDRLVAVKIMEWKEAFPGDIMHGAFCDHDGNWRWLENDGSLSPDELFQPSANIAHAWEVVERMSEHHNKDAPALWWNFITGHAVVPGFANERAENGMSLHSMTSIFALKPSIAPLAISRAALKAVDHP